MPPDQLPVDNSPEFEALLLQNDENAQVNQNQLDSLLMQGEEGNSELKSINQTIKEDSDKVKKVQIVPSNDENELATTFFKMLRGPRGEDGYTPEKGKDYYTKEEIAEVVKEIQDSIRIPEDGIDGYTPVRGEDYFTDEDISSMVDDVFSRIPTPKDGKDAEVDYEMVISECIARIPKPKNGKNGKNSAEMTSEQILDKIRGLLSYNDLKDLPTLWKNVASRDYDLTELKDVSITSPTNGQVLKYNSTTRKWTNDTDTGGAPGGSDTEIQFNNNGAFDGSPNFTWDYNSDVLGVGGDIFFREGANRSITVEQTTTPDSTGYNLSVTAGKGLGTGSTGGNLTLSAGNGDVEGVGGETLVQGGRGYGAAYNGGNAVLRGGGGDNGPGGDARVEGGVPASGYKGGSVFFTGGDATGGNGDGGDVNISAGDKSGAGVNGKIYLRKNGSSFAAILDTGSIAASNKTFTFPNSSGTLALTSDLTNYVVGPASSTDDAIVRFDGITGKLIQDYTSGAPTISDTGAVTIPLTTGNSLVVDTDTFVVDATNNRVGVKTASPGNALSIGAVSSALSGAVASTGQSIRSSGSVVLGAENPNASSSSAGGFIALYSNDGAAMASGDRLGGFLFGGSSSASSLRNTALIGAFASEAWVDTTNYGTRIAFETTTNGSTSRTEKMTLSDAGLLGIGTTAPTHTLTLPSTSTGIALYNTADQTTNYERALFNWSSNIFVVGTEKGGSGSNRTVRLRTPSRTFDVVDSPGANGVYQMLFSTSNGTYTGLGLTGSGSAASGIATSLKIFPTHSQSGTAGYNALLIDVTESSTGSGTKRLISAQVGSVDKFVVDNTGNTTVAGNIIATKQIYYAAEIDNGNSGASDTIDWTLGNIQKTTMTADCTYTFTAPTGPGNYTLRIIQNGTGNWTATLPSGKWTSGIVPLIKDTASKWSILSIYYDGSAYSYSLNANLS